MNTIAFSLIYLMVAINPATGQWEAKAPGNTTVPVAINPATGQWEANGEFVFPDQQSCLVNRQAWGDAVLGDASKYFCLAYKDTRYMMEILQNGHWLPLCARGMPYGAGHGVDNEAYDNKEECLRRVRDSGHDIQYRCVPYSFSYVDKDDPPPWTLKFRLQPSESPSLHRWFYTRADCVSMGRYWVGRNPQATFECIHS
jgi:hypothetical protein